MSLRILHLVASMDRGGVETWLLHVLRNIDRERYRFDFAVLGEERGAYEEEVLAMGSRVFHIGTERRPLRFARRLTQLLRSQGPYDVVHGHLHHGNGLALYLARREGVETRISHVHNDSRSIDGAGSLVKKTYRRLMKAANRRFGTLHLAVGSQAAQSLHGAAWREDPKVRLLPCGLEFAPYRRLPDPEDVREEWGIPKGAPVFGTVGRITVEKNHGFLLTVLSELLRSRADARLLLVGDGPLRGELQGQVQALGLRDRVIFCGSRQDVPRLLSAMDVFLFPSLYEGLGLAAIEAQAAGLPCLLSTGVSDEVIVSEQVERLPLGAGAPAWAEAALGLLEGRRGRQREALSRIESGPFGIDANLRGLEAAYALQGPMNGRTS